MVLTSSMFGHLCAGRDPALVPVVTLPIAGLHGPAGVRRRSRPRRKRPRSVELKRLAERYLDEVGFVVHKDSRDTIRGIHRQIRDHYVERAERLERTLQQAIAGRRVGRARAARRAAPVPERGQLRSTTPPVRRASRSRVCARAPRHAPRRRWRTPVAVG